MNDADTIHCRSHVLQTPGDLLVPFASWPKKGRGIKRKEHAERERERRREITGEATNLRESIWRVTRLVKIPVYLSASKKKKKKKKRYSRDLIAIKFIPAGQFVSPGAMACWRSVWRVCLKMRDEAARCFQPSNRASFF